MKRERKEDKNLKVSILIRDNINKDGNMFRMCNWLCCLNLWKNKYVNEMCNIFEIIDLRRILKLVKNIIFLKNKELEIVESNIFEISIRIIAL